MTSDTAPYVLLSLAWRTALALGLAVLAAHLLLTTQYYATILFLASMTLGLMFGIAHLLLQMQSAAESAAANHVIAGLQAERKRTAATQDHLQALLDTVSAALLVLKEDGRAVGANRTARLLLRGEEPRLSDIAAIGSDAAKEILRLAPGARAVVRLANGQQMLTATGQFSGGGQNQRLISLQAVVGELDAVQLKAWEDMSRVLAHEIMNSLTPIASLSESLAGMVRQEAASPETVEAVDVIARRSQGLAGFVTRYRQMAQLPEPQLQTISLRAFADDIQTLMAGRLDRVRYQCRVEAQTVTADPDLLSQAVINLLYNAVDAVANQKNPLIEIDFVRADQALVISVKDNGQGIAAEFADDIFVPFFTTKPAGSGIGLSIVRQILMKHGGRVEASSNETGGATFRLILPDR